MGSPVAEEQQTARKVARSVTLRVALANVVGAILAFLNLSAGVETSTRRPGLPLPDDVISLIVLVVFLAVVVPTAIWWGGRIASPALRWVEDGRDPEPRELEAVIAQPRRQAFSASVMWVAAALVFGALNFVFDPSGRQALIVGVGVLIGGVTAGVVTYLLVEGASRPVFARALIAAESLDPIAGMGMRPRLMLSWALGAVIPLLSITFLSVTAFIRGSGSPPLPLVLFDVVVGLAAGWLLMRSASSSVTDPLEDVRRALRSVQDGDLDEHLDVTDGGEIGFLQSSFNRMVAGLRERRRLEDLFGRHVGTEVARRALEEGVGLGGERREATALFVDVAGSTALAHERPPEEVVGMLNAFFEAVVGSVAREGGFVNKFEGDGALCVFGVPVAQPDHAARGLRAAVAIRDEVLRLAQRYPGFDAGIGVASGEVVAGNVGSAQRYEYTVIGDPVNVAARLTEAAKSRPARILATGSTPPGWTDAGTLELRGRVAPVSVVEPAATR